MATIEQGKHRLCGWLNDRQKRFIPVDEVLFTLVRYWGFSLKRARTILLEVIDENPNAIVLQGVSEGLVDALNMNGSEGSKRCQSWAINRGGWKTRMWIDKPLYSRLADMKLPNGTTCSDCKHFGRCSWLLSREESSTHCDWWPSRFVRKG